MSLWSVLSLVGTVVGLIGLPLSYVLHRRQLTVAARDSRTRDSANALLAPLEELREELTAHTLLEDDARPFKEIRTVEEGRRPGAGPTGA